MSQNLNRKPANSVNGDTDYDDVRVTTLGREFRGLQSEPDRYHATAGGNMGEVNDFRGFNDKNYFEGFEEMDSNFGSLNDFSGFINIGDFQNEILEIKDFSGFDGSYNKDDTLDFSGFVGETGLCDDNRDSFDQNNNNSDISDPDRRLNNRETRNRESYNNRRVIKIGTWNVRTMSPNGKIEEVQKEMKRMNLGILGLSEVRWPGAGKMDSDDFTFYYSGGERLEKLV